MVEIADKETYGNSDFIYNNDVKDDETNKNLKAVASWDSSVHQSPYLNQLTPFDKHVYITAKVNVKFKLISDFRQFSKTNKQEYIDIVLRKRISVCVYLPNSGAKLMI